MHPRIAIRASAFRQLLLRLNLEFEPKSLQATGRLSQWLNQSPRFPPRRTFISTPLLLKKGGSPKKGAAVTDNDPHNMSSLEADIAKCLETVGSDLYKLRMGGRFNPEAVEDVRVVLEKGGKKSFRLGELANVVPKGTRSLSVHVGEKDHIKAIVSAITGLPFWNLLPQADPHDPSLLTIAIPPTTKESRDLALEAASKVGKNASTAINQVRASMQKRLNTMEVEKLARGDDVRKARKNMEKLVEKAGADVKKMVDEKIKAMKQF